MNIGQTNLEGFQSSQRDYWRAYEALPHYVRLQVRELSVDVSCIPLIERFRQIKRDYPEARPREIWDFLMSVAKDRLEQDHIEIQFGGDKI